MNGFTKAGHGLNLVQFSAASCSMNAGKKVFPLVMTRVSRIGRLDESVIRRRHRFVTGGRYWVIDRISEGTGPGQDPFTEAEPCLN